MNVRIKPNIDEITLTSEGDYELICAGDVPVTWNFTYYFQNPPLQKISSIDIVSNKLGKIFSDYDNDRQYSSILTLSRVNYLVTGNYYCSPSSPGVELDEQNSKNIYIFVQHKTHLLAVPEDLKYTLYQDEIGEVIIPCRPTTSDVNVVLKKDDQVISDYIYYDEKIGYLLRPSLFQISSEYKCEANKENIVESRSFIVYNNPHAIQINIDADSDTIVMGQNVSLNCSVNMFFYHSITINWKLSDKQQLRAHQGNVFKQIISTGIIRYVTTLLLQNISTEDDGKYVCEVITHSERIINATFNLKAVESGTFLNLEMIDGEYKVIRPIGFKSVEWIIKISANPIANHTWINGYGEKVTQSGVKMNKIYLKKNETSSKLVVKYLEYSDSMVYILKANNGFYQKQIVVQLLVKDKPSLYIKSEILNNEAYEVGKIYSFKCITTGYPLPKIEWDFKKCSNYPECESQTQTPVFEVVNNILNFQNFELEVIATIELNVTENGKLICITSNELGKSMKEHEIPVTDVPNNFDIRGPNIVDAGGTVTIECGVSKHEYTDRIQWKHRTVIIEDETSMFYESNIPYITNHTDANVIITTNETKFSYHSYLTIKNIATNYSGIFNCIADQRNQFAYFIKTDYLSINLTVVDPSAPVFYNTSNSNSEIEIGESVQWWCYAYGIPFPTISWHKDNHSLHFNKNNNRFLLQDRNQTLLITSIKLEDRGSYDCYVSNKKGSIVSTNKLIVTDERGYRERINFMVFYSVIAILIGVLTIVCVMYIKRSQKFKKELELANFNFENGGIESWNPDLTIGEQAELLPYNKEWEFPRNKLKLGKKLGSGAFGVVYKAEAIGIIHKDTITTVAVKTIKPSTDPFYKNSLVSELKIMIHLDLMVIVEYCCFGNIHQYLLKRRDSFTDQLTPDGSLDYKIKSTPKYFVNLNYEVVSNKIIQSEEKSDSDSEISFSYTAEEEQQRRSSHGGDYENDSNKSLCTHDLIYWTFQISQGMAYLASRNILHGDLAARNILLAEENIIKICDFGLAKNMYKSDNYKKKSKKDLLPVKWMAIESLRDRVFSTQSDVWAFGIVLWEVFTLSVTPYPNIQSVNDLYDKLNEGYRMERPKYSNSEIYSIMLDCWKMDPSSRPSFNVVADRLGTLLKRNITSHYINLNKDYVMKNTKGSLSTDYLSLVTSPTYVNCSSISESKTNFSSENKDEFVLKSIFHNPIQ